MLWHLKNRVIIVVVIVIIAAWMPEQDVFSCF